MEPNAEGFFYPIMDESLCNQCGLCAQICPVGIKKKTPEGANIGPLVVYAAWNLDETIRCLSSSGGLFTALAEHILAQGGSVVGAAFDDELVVRHIIIETKEELAGLRGSKYVQSELSPNLFSKIKNCLQQGKSVLFSGTPCQVAGIRQYLRKPYKGLLCCDIICHGVPSPLFLQHYIQYNNDNGDEIKGLSFRDKSKGWKAFGMRQDLKSSKSIYKDLHSDPYLRGFLQNCSLRESCYACRFANIKREGDITLADFWCVDKKYPEYDKDDKGTSLILVNTEKGKDLIEAVWSTLFIGAADLDTAIVGNACLVRPCLRPAERDTFYEDLKSFHFSKMILKYRLHRPSRLKVFARRGKRLIKMGLGKIFF